MTDQASQDGDDMRRIDDITLRRTVNRLVYTLIGLVTTLLLGSFAHFFTVGNRIGANTTGIQYNAQNIRNNSLAIQMNQSEIQAIKGTMGKILFAVESNGKTLSKVVHKQDKDAANQNQIIPKVDRAMQFINDYHNHQLTKDHN